MKKLSVLLLILLPLSVFAQSSIPKREFRAAWVATVTNLDWPSSPGLTVTTQQNQAIAILNELKTAGVNAVIFQIRTECDALYASPFEPWSYWLTGQQGVAPNPVYDPLKFWIDEAHKRGMELHAWFNPYRSVKTVGSYPVHASHISNQHPDWVIHIGTYKFLNPGLPQVEEYNTKIIMDVVRRYDVDGVHMDDYFYPYPPDQISHQDTATFRMYPRGFTNINDWRRDNTNSFLRHLNDSIMAAKPHIKFGMSPFGIWKSGTPPGITGMDAYSVIYCDAITWLQDQSVDYITPQLYWPFGGGQDYAKLNNWWSDSTFAHNRHFYPGHGAHRTPDWAPNELPNQIRYNRNNPKCDGSVFFRALSFRSNAKGFMDSLVYGLYIQPALPPVMNWKETVPPNAPSNLRFQLNSTSGHYEFLWDKPTVASDGDTAMRYAVYRFPSAPAPGATDQGNYLFGTSGTTVLPYNYGHFAGTTGNYYVVTALDRNNNESGMSNVVQFTQVPGAPVPTAPLNGANDIKASVIIKWTGDALSYAFEVQVSTDPTFATGLIKDLKGYKGKELTISGLLAQTTYYWRLRSYGFGGASDYSSVYSFKTGFPLATVLVYPPHAMTVPTLTPTLYWEKDPIVTSYRLQIGTGNPIGTNNMILDTTFSASDSSYRTKILLQNKSYFWKMQSSNALGTGDWSATRGFKTHNATDTEDESSLPTEFQLGNNFPNPFNPVTVINYSLPQGAEVKLSVHSILGEEVAMLKSGYTSAGNHSALFDATNLPSGIYIYRLQAGHYSSIKKMVLMK